MAENIKLVFFSINENVYATDITSIKSIEKDMQIVPVPNSMECIKGIINLRGEVVPTYSLKRKFKVEDNNTSKAFLITEINDFKLALEVDSVMEIKNYDMDNVIDMPKIISSEDNLYMDYVVNDNGKLVIIIDVKMLMSKEELEGVKKITEDFSDAK